MAYRIGPTEPGSAAAVYASAGFRPDLVDDLLLVVALGGSVFSATRDGQVVGVASCLPFAATGWVGGVAVLPEHARQGLGTQLTERAVAALSDAGAESVLLHATPMARRLYERMGFVAENEFVELAGPRLPPSHSLPEGVRAGADEDLDTVLALDREATGEDRSGLLRALWAKGATVYDADGIIGFHLLQIPTAAGVVVSAQPAVGHILLNVALSGRHGPLRVPFPASHDETQDLLVAAGYTERVRTTRMYLGPPVAAKFECMVSVFNLYWG